MDKSLSSAEIDRLFIEGDRNLHQGKFSAAIDIFEQLLKTIESDHNQHFNIQRNLVKAYQQNEQSDQAIALCQLMIDSNCNAATLWGTNFMTRLMPNIEQEVVSKPGNQELKEVPVADNISHHFKIKTLSEFKQYCQDNLLDSLRELEKKRVNTLLSIVISGIVCLIATWALCQLIFGILRINNSIFIFHLTALISISPVWIAFCRGCIQVYGLGFKHNIIEVIIRFIDSQGTLKYASNLFLEDKRQTILGFTRSQIFRDELHEPDSLEQEDCVYGSIGQTDIFFAEIVVENIKTGYLNEFEQAEIRGKSSLFRGLFFEAKFPKSFVSRTFILPNTFNSKLAYLNNWRGEEVKLEDPKFQHIFKVYSDNQVEARYILSTNLMNRLVRFNQKANRKVHLSFIDGFMYIAIPYRQNLFEPKLFKNMKSFSPLKEYFFDLQLMIGIVDDLNLNRHIWKK